MDCGRVELIGERLGIGFAGASGCSGGAAGISFTGRSGGMARSQLAARRYLTHAG